MAGTYGVSILRGPGFAQAPQDDGAMFEQGSVMLRCWPQASLEARRPIAAGGIAG